MNCQKCNLECVVNSALGKEFYYCRTCKQEVSQVAAAYPPVVTGTVFSSHHWGVAEDQCTVCLMTGVEFAQDPRPCLPPGQMAIHYVSCWGGGGGGSGSHSSDTHQLILPTLDDTMDKYWKTLKGVL